MHLKQVQQLLFLTACVLAAIDVSTSVNCPELQTAPNTNVTSCTNGNSERSVCSIQCNPGMENVGGGTRVVCWCAGPTCAWQGAQPVCKESTCLYPDMSLGKIRIADEWGNGFALILEVDNIPTDIENGWSIVIVFNKPLGKQASLFSWNMRLTAESNDKRAFTLNNNKHNQNFHRYFSQKTNPRMLIIVTDVKGYLPIAGFVGLFKTPVKDANCVRPQQLTPFENLPSSSDLDMLSEGAYVPGDRKTSAATTPVTPVLLTSRNVAATALTTQFRTFATRPATTTKATPVPTTRKKTTAKPTTRPTQASTTASTTSKSPISLSNGGVMEINGRFCKKQIHPDHYGTKVGWVERGVAAFSGKTVLNTARQLKDWMMVVVFSTPITDIEVWNCQVLEQSSTGYLWILGPFTYNTVMHSGNFEINFNAKQKHITQSNPTGTVYLCSKDFVAGDRIITQPDIGSSAPATLVLQLTTLSPAEGGPTAVVPTNPSLRTRPTESRCLESSPTGVVIQNAPQTQVTNKTDTDNAKYNYNMVLYLSILFYEAQRAGYLPGRYKRIPWRGHSSLKDGCAIRVDLSRGWYDAGDHMKFNFPMAFSVTTLAWGGLLFKDAYVDAGEMLSLKGSIKWPVEYLMECHISKYEFVGQVGDPVPDHNWWGRPEQMTMKRSVYKITKENPGSELAAEAAAALAASSILLRKNNVIFAKQALKHAIELYDFADKFRGLYHKSIPEAASYYKSESGYNDELLWGAAWLYKATKKPQYLERARRIYELMRAQYFTGPMFSWDHKLIGAQVLLANITGEDIFRDQVISFLDNMMELKRTPQGMAFYSIWAPNKYAGNIAFIAFAASLLEPPLPKKGTYLEFAKQQVHLLLGDGGRSYVVGFGDNPPTQPHHRSSSCEPYPAWCDYMTGFENPGANHYTLYGALVGGPSVRGIYTDSRPNFKQTEVSLDNNAGFQSAVAGLKYFTMLTRPKTGRPKSG